MIKRFELALLLPFPPPSTTPKNKPITTACLLTPTYQPNSHLLALSGSFCSTMATSGSTPSADILASIEEQVLFVCQADAISLNTVTKSYEQAGVGDFKLLKLETEFVKGYFLALQGSKKLNIKSRYRISPEMVLNASQRKRHAITIKLIQEDIPYLDISFENAEDLDAFKKVFNKTIKILNKPIEVEKAETEGQDFTAVQDVEVEEEVIAPINPYITTIQPVKAAAFFNNVAKDLGVWEVYLSTKTINYLRQCQDKKTLKIVGQRIAELSQGVMSGDNAKPLTNSKGVPIFEAKTTRDQRVVWSVDIMPDDDKKVDRQVIKVWGIHTHAEINNKIWSSISLESLSRGKEYCRRCDYRKAPRVKGAGLNLPESWAWDASAVDEEVEKPNFQHSDEDFLELHKYLALEKFTPCTKGLFATFQAGLGGDTMHVFAVSAREQAIMNHEGSCFVLGRSGTGKTTSMVFRMLGVELSQPPPGGAHRRYRSIFCTHSPVLAAKVGEYYRKLLGTIKLDKLSDEQRAEAMRGKEKYAFQEKSSVFDMTGTGYKEDPLPRRFSELEPKHFPLFLSFDKLCALVEADYDLSYGRSIAPASAGPAGETDATQLDELDEKPPPSILESVYDSGRNNNAEAQLVTYEKFVNNYWDHFDQVLTAGLDPALVWSEILGVIRGSEAAADAKGGFLTETDYKGLSDRTQGTFADRRGSIYAIFKTYMRIKMERKEKDAADRTHAILDQMVKYPNRVPKIDFVYIDEAQDNLIIDCKFIRSLCSNPSGHFFCGDTAQTIAAGASFRFDDLKASFYRLEESEPLVRTGLRQAIQPATFQLTTNYRSHGGICDAADALIKVIRDLFPNSIDHLDPEKGLVQGPKPSFLTQRSESIKEIFSSSEGTSEIEFGAHQCILVRSEKTRDDLREKLGKDAGLIMTISESKGLEFSDVVVYNFFNDSAATEPQWRVVLKNVPAAKAPRFDVTKHSIVCTELKKLYVALTRGRNNVWFWDDSDRVDPIKNLLDHQSLVHVVDPDSPLPKIGKASTAEEWKEQAQNLFERENYDGAALAYAKAGAFVESGISEAYAQRKKAFVLKENLKGRVLKALPASVVEAFRTTGEAFNSSADAAGREGTLPNGPGGLYRIAAECFEEASSFERAAEMWEKSQDYTRATLSYRRGGFFDMAVKICRSHPQHVNAEIREEILRVARIQYLRDPKTAKNASTLFTDLDEQIEFMRDFGLEAFLGDLLENAGRFDAAGDFAVQEGKIERAVDMYKKNNTPESTSKASDTLLTELYAALPFGAYKSSLNSIAIARIRNFTNLAFQLESKTRASNAMTPLRLELKVFFDSLEEERQKGLLKTSSSLTDVDYAEAAFLALEKALENPLPLKKNKVRQRLLIVQTWYLHFVAEGSKIVKTPRLTESSKLQRLFGFRPAEEDSTYTVLPSSFLQIEASKRSSSGNEAVFTSSTIVQFLQTAFAKNVVAKIAAQEDKFRASNLIQPPCLQQALAKSCSPTPGSTCASYHREPSREDLKSRCMIILNQIQLVDAYANLCAALGRPAREVETVRRFWLDLLCNCLYPPSSVLGSTTNVDLSQLHNGPAGLAVVRSWLNEYFARLDPSGGDVGSFFRDVQRLTVLFADFWPSDFDRLAGPQSSATKYVTSLSLDGKTSVVRDLFSGVRTLVLGSQGSMNGVDLKRGLNFIRFVLDQRFPMEISFFAAFAERIAVALVMSQRWEKKTNSDGLHGLFGPISLLSYLHHSTDYRIHVPREHVTHFLDSLKALALQMLIRKQGFWFQTKTLAPRERDFESHVFLERIIYLETWCSWNLESEPAVRNSVMQSIQNLGKHKEYKAHNLHSKFTSAKDWGEILKKAHRSRIRSPLDPVLCLQQVGKPETKHPRAIALLPFKDWDDLGVQIRTRAQKDEEDIKGASNGPVASFVANGTSNGTTTTPTSPPTTSTATNGATTHARTPTVAPPTAGSSPSTANDASSSSQPSPDSTATPAQTTAAKQVQKWYRARKAARTKDQGATVNKLEADRRVRLDKFVPTSKKILDEKIAGRTPEQKKADKEYAIHLRGPFSNLFYVLESCLPVCKKGKKDLSSRFTTAEHLELDLLGQSITQANSLIKEVQALTSSVGPTSLTHGPSRSLVKLKESSKKIISIAQRTIRLFDTNRNKIQKILALDLELGEKGMLRAPLPRAAPKPVKVAKKPAMGRDDERENYAEGGWGEEEEDEPMPGGFARRFDPAETQ
ncbi:hypothetical protein BDY24DRAFT_58944 [Mrakia frigida]|uniref:uncharacterized protein n=1 Tax=Mrakia frigida TaxID=29902 RepID=UPI003FCBF7B8